VCGVPFLLRCHGRGSTGYIIFSAASNLTCMKLRTNDLRASRPAKAMRSFNPRHSGVNQTHFR
jgi:hypothetical protein